MTLKCSLGGRDSTSFITVDEADQFIKDLPDDTAEWDALSTTEKEYRLELAAQLMGYMPWAGRQTYCGQALPFPRRIRGSHICCPCEIQETQAFLAYSVIHRGLANRPTTTEEKSGTWVSSVSLGGLLSVGFSGKPVTGGNVLDQILRSMHFPVYLRIKRYLSQIRGGSIQSESDDDYPECSTTTTTTTCTTTSTTTT